MTHGIVSGYGSGGGYVMATGSNYFTDYDIDPKRYTDKDLEVVAASLIKKLGAPEKVLKKCNACGQWGAIQTECKHCGHPIDGE